MKNLQEIKFADLSNVYIDDKTNTSHCKKHGAMNKMTNFQDKSGIWRCLGPVSIKNDTLCRSGCQY